MLPPHTGAGVTGGIGGVSVGPCGGPQGSVDKPFLLHDGRVGLRASLDKGWYTHGEDVNVTVNIRNDSRKTVRKVRVSFCGIALDLRSNHSAQTPEPQPLDVMQAIINNRITHTQRGGVEGKTMDTFVGNSRMCGCCGKTLSASQTT